MPRPLATVLFLSLALLPPSVASAGSLEKPLATCDSGYILDIITARFSARARTYLNTDLDIVRIDQPRQVRQTPRDDTHRVGRDYCAATAVTTDGEKRALWYLIERDFAFAGFGSSVEFCLGGLDPWHVYGAHCASLR